MASRVIETVSTSGVSLERARKVIRAGQQRAQEIGVAMNIALVDAGANLVAFEPMEGAWLAAHDRLPIAKIVNATVIGLDEAPRRSFCSTRTGSWVRKERRRSFLTREREALRDAGLFLGAGSVGMV
jgi:hypothetical protein